MPPSHPPGAQPYVETEHIRKQLTVIAGLSVVGLMAFGLALSFYRNILFEHTLQELDGRNRTLFTEIDQGYRDLAYFRSEQFKDKFAKEKLGLVNPGEKVLIILREPLRDVQALFTLSPEEREQALYEEFLRQTPVIEHWKLFLFHQDKLEQLRRGL